MLRTSARAFSTSSARSAQAFARAQILGRVGQELVETEAASGVKYVKYPIAVQTKKDGPTSWFNVIAFNEQQINYMTEYVKKGALVHVEASVQHDVFEKEDGTKLSAVTFLQNKIDLLMNPKNTEVVEEE